MLKTFSSHFGFASNTIEMETSKCDIVLRMSQHSGLGCYIFIFRTLDSIALSMPCTFSSEPETMVEESETEGEGKKSEMRLYVGVFLHLIRFSIYNGFECKRCVRNVTERVCRRGLFVIFCPQLVENVEVGAGFCCCCCCLY